MAHKRKRDPIKFLRYDKFKIHQVSSAWEDGQTPYSNENFTCPVYAAEK